MKIIQAMKQVKDLTIKAEELRQKVAKHCVDYTHETPVYENQSNKISEWIQAHTDIVQEIARLRTAIQKTNISTEVTIDLGGKKITKTIAEWIHRRRDLANLDLAMQNALTDKGLKEGNIVSSSGERQELKIRRYYKPEVRDEKKEVYRSEPNIIDSTLEVINAITDLVEA